MAALGLNTGELRVELLADELRERCRRSRSSVASRPYGRRAGEVCTVRSKPRMTNGGLFYTANRRLFYTATVACFTQQRWLVSHRNRGLFYTATVVCFSTAHRSSV